MEALDYIESYLAQNNPARLLHNYYYKEFPPGWSRKSGHSHSSLEVVCCVNGTAYYLIENLKRPVVLNKNELILIRHNTYHTMYVSQNSKCNCVGVHLSTNFDSGDKLDEAFSELFFRDLPSIKLYADNTIIECMKRITLEMNKKNDGYEHVIKSEILRLIVFLMRCHNTGSKQFPSQNDYVANALAFIHGSLSDIISTTDIAAHVHISPEYLMRLFKQNIGKTVMQVVLELRMDRAEHLLTNTSMSISKIADECGYLNLQHFSMAFKKFTDTTPSRFRKESQQLLFSDADE